MGLLRFKGMRRFVLFMLVLMAGLADGNVVLIGKNVSLSFDDIEANFAPAIKESGECGVLYEAEPLDACTPLKNKVDEVLDSAFALIIRGGCTFDDKVRNAEEAGFKTAIVYNNEHGPLVAKFHAICVDSWLTTWRTFCPICKRDARTSTGNPPPSECTPLLPSAASTPNSSFHSSIATSSALQMPPAVQINPTPPRSPFTSHTHSLVGIIPSVPSRSHSLASIIPRVPNPRRSSSRSPPISISSSIDLRNTSYHKTYASPSLGLPQSSPINTRFIMSSYIPSPNNASTSYITGSSSWLPYLCHCTESGASLSAMDSSVFAWMLSLCCFRTQY